MASAPTVMVSSTFFDLKQVRADLRAFLEEELGYTSLLSQYGSFPVDPDLDTVENCRRRVEENADLLLLVIGGRYGSLDPEGDRSVTNLEYLTARQKGIPIYVFVQKGILDIIPVWEANPDADLSRVADSPRLFGFIEEIRSQQRHWVFPFETAQDIVARLRNQFAHLMNEGLLLRAKLSGAGIPWS